MAEPDSSAPAPAPGPTPPSLPSAPFERVNDFPDGLSPMLVKELRQGLRTNTFVILFLVLQGILALVLLTAGPIAAAEDSASGAAGGIVSRIVFCFYALGVLVVQPLRGISAVATEIKQNTIDLMVLTRLSAWRIVWGKWSSIMSQSALIVLAILPYLILRYFFGGMQLFAELALMLYIFAVSGALTAFTVGISAIGSVLIRGLVVVAGSAALVVFIPFYFTPDLPDYVDFLSFSNRNDSFAALGTLALILYAGYFFLELGATAIAPAAENRATRKRLTGLGVIILSFLLLQFIDRSLALTAALVVAGLVSIDIFSERSDFPAVVCKPFLRFGTPGRLLGRVLYPGWATGTLFFVLMMAVVAGLILLTASGDQRLFTTAAIAFGAMIFPAAVIQLFARNTPNRFSTYVSLLVISFLLTFILSTLHFYVKNKLLLWIFSPVPMVLFPLNSNIVSGSNPDTVLFAAAGVAGSYLLITLAGALPRVARISKLEDEALDDGGD